jgi:hypothetical protein
MAMRVLRGCGGNETDMQEEYDDNVKSIGELNPTMRRTGGRFASLKNASDDMSVISKSTTNTPKFMPVTNYSKAEVEADMKEAMEILNANRKPGTLAIGNEHAMQNTKILNRRLKAMDYADKLLNAQHHMYTVPKNCNNIERRIRHFIFKNTDKEAILFAPDPKDNMFLSHDKYAQGNIPWSEDAIGELDNVYICQIRICHGQNNTNSTFGFRLMIDPTRSSTYSDNDVGDILPGAHTYGSIKQSSGAEKLEPFHFILPANRSMVKEESVYINTYQGNDISEKFPYITAARETIVDGSTKSPNSNTYIVPGAHPICYWLICNNQKFTKLQRPRKDGKNYEVPAAQYEFAIKEIAKMMKHVSIVDMTTLKLRMVRIDSPSTTIKKKTGLDNVKDTEDDKNQTISVHVEVTYLFREHIVNAYEEDAEEEEDEDDENDANEEYEDEYDLSD